MRRFENKDTETTEHLQRKQNKIYTTIISIVTIYPISSERMIPATRLP
ncbi:hypothetical protein HMPREF9441_01333 [Paraprevotella clara YIT 11840]|uniref:Uncharacterized protein n=1 Tax=Paraprevotella clara YIT 11840 TaxID=762968 RepID=G5SPQ0_9BACT|nr:hypothetical protein HMPREF9441_01333 [Paraprevotella clara YIT 11840]